MKECLKPHPIMHSLTGLGLGLLAASLAPTLTGSNGASFGLALIAAGLLGEFLVNPGNKGKKVR